MKRTTIFLAAGVLAFCLTPVFAASHRSGGASHSAHAAASHSSAHFSAPSHSTVHVAGPNRGVAHVNSGGVRGGFRDNGGRFDGRGYRGYGYGYWPWWYGAGLYDPYYSTYGYYGPDYYYPPNYYYNDYYPPSYPNVTAPIPPANQAYIEVIVPDSQARVWINGQPTTAVGTDRLYVTTPTAGSTPYTVKAAWMQNGQEVATERQIQVNVGLTSVVDFDTAP